jgi:hypothetical protein
MSLVMCWFLDAGNKEPPQAHLTGVQKAPRHEVAGSWALARQQALWGAPSRGFSLLKHFNVCF